MYSFRDPILITGVAGFIGHAVAKKFISSGFNIIGIDNLNNYYNKNLKIKRIDIINKNTINIKNKFYFKELDIEDINSLENVFNEFKPKVVINLAAQAGVRYSLKNPDAYVKSNLVGFVNILECCKKFKINNLIYASSSSVYGSNTNLPFSETQVVNHPVSLYAATKKSNELIAHTYSHLYKIPTTALRFFTVYGPWGRPDMAPMIFAKSIMNNQPIKIFNNGLMSRDFTYIDDVSEAVFRCALKPAELNKNFDKSKPDPSTSFAPYRIFNVGNSSPIKLLDFVELLEESLGIKAIKELHPMQPGDVVETLSDTSALENWINFRPITSFKDGIKLFADWYLNYSNHNLF